MLLPAGMELRPSLQMREATVAVGFTGESVSDPFATGVLARELPGVLARVLPEAGANCIVFDLRNVREITHAGIYALKTMGHSLRSQPYNPVLVVRDKDTHEFLRATDVSQHLAVVAGEDGLRAWLAQVAEDEVTFSEENVRKMIADNLTWDDVEAAVARGRERARNAP